MPGLGRVARPAKSSSLPLLTAFKSHSWEGSQQNLLLQALRVIPCLVLWGICLCAEMGTVLGPRMHRRGGGGDLTPPGLASNRIRVCSTRNELQKVRNCSCLGDYQEGNVIPN